VEDAAGRRHHARPRVASQQRKHALVQDTAYASPLKSRRRELHRAIAHVLAERFRDTAETQPELLAVHYTEAGDGEPAVAAWQRAAEHAVARSALVAQIREGLNILAPTGQRTVLGLFLELLSEAYARNGTIAEALRRWRMPSALCPTKS